MLRKILLGVMFISLFGTYAAEGAEVPNVLNYQGTLYDQGGNLMNEAGKDVLIRIFNAQMEAVFEERHTTDIIDGDLSLSIGGGNDPYTNASSGGVPIDIFTSDGTKYIEVAVDSYPAESLTEITSVPYSLVAEKAYTVEAGSIGSSEIKDGAIELKHLKDETIEELSSRVVNDALSESVVSVNNFTTYKETLKSPSGATEIGVKNDFIYSSSASVQEVLRDLDSAIRKRAEDVSLTEQKNLSLDGNDKMAGNLDMGMNSITELKRPESDRDATPKDYVDMKMRDALDSLHYHEEKTNNPHSVTTAQIGAPTLAELTTHTTNTSNPHGVTPAQIGAATQDYADNIDQQNLSLNGGDKMTGPLDMDSHVIQNLTVPSNPNDAATKSYVDMAVSGPFTDLSDTLEEGRSKSVFKSPANWTVGAGTATKAAVAMLGVYGTLSGNGDVEIYLDPGMRIVGSNIWHNPAHPWWQPGDYVPSLNGEYRYNVDTGRFAWFSNNDDFAGLGYNMVIYYLVDIE